MSSDSAQNAAIQGLPYRMQIPAASSRWGHDLRRASFWLLAGISLLAVLATLGSFAVWLDILRTCLEVFIFRSAQSVLLAPGTKATGYEIFRGLDISSASTFVLFLLCAQLAYAGLRNTIYLQNQERRAGVDWRRHAYPHSQFPLLSPGFRSLCIQLGLLGTLLSFVLAALILMAQLESPAPDKPENLGTAVKSVVAEPETNVDPAAKQAGLAGQASEATDTGGSGNAITAEFSRQFFMLLCASVVSTFVGCFVAYLVIPPLNRLNYFALGLHQVAPPDEEAIVNSVLRNAQDLAGQMGHAAQALRGAETIMEKIEPLASASDLVIQKVGDFIAAADHSTKAIEKRNEQLADLADSMVQNQKAIEESLQVSKRQETRLAKTLSTFEKMATTFTGFVEQSHKAIGHLETTSSHCRQTAESSAEVMIQVASVAGSLVESNRKNTKTTEQILGVMRSMDQKVKSIQQSNHDLSQKQLKAANEQSQQKLAHDHLAHAVEQLKYQVDILEQFKKEQTEGAEVLKPYLAPRNRLGAMLGSVLAWWPFHGKSTDKTHSDPNNGRQTLDHPDEEANS